ncbi:hypothetical protein AB0F17_47300 [Nonomuraea sp. NPDC026600]|uniref:hypothetical protein n=1 Tax=Nonomuraea sp. NPDC026600 TaxID=3155363 RepID=UPI0033F6DBCE
MSALVGMKTGIALLEDPRYPGDAAAAGALFDRIATRIAREHNIPKDTAGRALGQAIIFVTVAAQDTSRALSPSPEVDKAWDTFFLYSVEYHHHCARYGRFVHHTPNDNPEVLASDLRRFYSPAETADLLRREGYLVEDALWPRDAIAASKANCTACYTGDHVSDGDDDI